MMRILTHIPHRSCDPTSEAVSLDMAKLGFFSRQFEVAEHTSSSSCLSLSGSEGVWATQQVSFAPDWSMLWWNLKFLKCLRISPPEYRDILLINSKHCNNYSLSKFPSNRHFRQEVQYILSQYKLILHICSSDGLSIFCHGNCSTVF